MDVLLKIFFVQALSLVAFAPFHRTNVLRLAVLRQQIAVCKRSAKRPRLKTEIGRSGSSSLGIMIVHEVASLSDRLRVLLQLTSGFRVSKGRYRIEDRFDQRCIVQQ